MNAEETAATDQQVEEEKRERTKEGETEDKKGLIDEIMEVISRSSLTMSEEERQSTPSASGAVEPDERPKEDTPPAVKEEAEGESCHVAEEETEVKEGDAAALEAPATPPAEEEANPAGAEGEKEPDKAETTAATAEEDSLPPAAEEDKVEPSEC